MVRREKEKKMNVQHRTSNIELPMLNGKDEETEIRGWSKDL